MSAFYFIYLCFSPKAELILAEQTGRLHNTTTLSEEVLLHTIIKHGKSASPGWPLMRDANFKIMTMLFFFLPEKSIKTLKKSIQKLKQPDA